MKSGIELHKPDPQSMKNRSEDQDFLVCNIGRLIGHTDSLYFYVYDGKVWTSGLNNTCIQYADYFEFCDTIREGGVHGFKPTNGFHLRNGG